MTSAPLISVVVVNWNGAAVLERCLAQLAAQSHPRVEPIVVDDGSTDASLELVEAAARDAPIAIVRSATNRGVAAGRNLGIARARGELIAFLDNDGYAHPDWLAEAARLFAADPELGAVAPLVFFADHPLLLNGAGGTVNWRGYAADHCFDQPYEFASLPAAVLYPMGCGMVFRRTALEAAGPLDERLRNYYDDVELGIRVWARGFRIAVCPRAWVDHGGGGPRADRGAGEALLLGERHRIRTVLKYFPARRLPGFLRRELRLLVHLGHPGRRTVPLRAWLWNLRHFGSAWRIRRRFAGSAARWWSLVHPAWRLARTGPATNRALRPAVEAAGAELRCDGSADGAQLLFGWYPAEGHGGEVFRPSAPVASAMFALERPAAVCTLRWRAAPAVGRVTLSLRPLGRLDPIWQAVVEPPPPVWEHRRLACDVAPGRYELLLCSVPTHGDARARERGVDVAAIAFDAVP